MTKFNRCDECASEYPCIDDGRYRSLLLMLEYNGTTDSNAELGGDFCSWACLAKYADRHRESDSLVPRFTDEELFTGIRGFGDQPATARESSSFDRGLERGT